MVITVSCWKDILTSDGLDENGPEGKIEVLFWLADVTWLQIQTRESFGLCHLSSVKCEKQKVTQNRTTSRQLFLEGAYVPWACAEMGLDLHSLDILTAIGES